MLRARIACAGIAALLALAIAVALLPNVRTAAADSGETITTELQPGLNLAGWTEPEAPVSAIFDAIPALDYVYAWDAGDQWFRWATRTDSGLHGDLDTLAPGMGLWLDVGGNEPVTWTRALIPQSGLASLTEGWNLVTWAGADGVSINAAVAELDPILTTAWAGERGMLRTGDALWLEVSRDKPWWQPHPPPRFEFIGHFTPETREQLRAQVDEVIAYYVRRFGVAAPGLTVRYGDENADHTECGGYASKTILLKDPCFRAIAHEYAHAIQKLIARHGYSPAWLVEGVANRWSAQFYDAIGDRTYDAHLRDITIPNARQVTAPLRQMQTYDELLATSGSYSLAHLAVDRLVALAGDGALYDYFARRSGYGTWEEGFQAIFGLTAGGFYDAFESYRADFAPPHSRIGGVVLGPSGEPAEGITVWVWDVRTGNGLHMTTDAEGTFEWLSDAAGSYVVSLTAGACALDWSSDDPRLLSIGAGRASFVIERDGLTGVVINLTTDPSEGCRRLSGLVRDSALEPLDDVGVYLYGLTSTGFQFLWGSRVSTGEGGSFSIMVSPGAFRVGVDCRGAGDVWYGGEGPVVEFSSARSVRVGANDVGGIAITLPLPESEVGKRACIPPGAPQIRGRVVGAEGEPLAGVWVGYVGNSDGSPTPFFSVIMGRAASDTAGEFTLDWPEWPPFMRVFLDQETFCPSGEGLPGAWFDLGVIEADGVFTPATDLPQGLSVEAPDAENIVIRFPAACR